MTTARDLLELINDYVVAKRDDGDDAALQSIAQRFDVAFGDAVLDRASMQNEA